IKGANNASAIGTLVERTTRLVLLVKLPHPHPATAAHVLQAFSDKLNRIAAPMRQSLTYDRGSEMAQHAQLSQRTGMKVYFCDPYKPWQRGSNENTNGLLRQYFPKGTDLSGYSQEQLDAVADELNGRPRMTLGYSTPLEVYAQHLQRLTQQPDSVH
ncbi:IS30 family transposase, partial [Acidovorax lacteus]